MFNLSDFIMKTLSGMIGRYPDFQVREYALNWYARGKLTEDHLMEVEVMLVAQYTPPVIPEIDGYEGENIAEDEAV